MAEKIRGRKGGNSYTSVVPEDYSSFALIHIVLIIVPYNQDLSNVNLLEKPEMNYCNRLPVLRLLVSR